MKQSEHQLVFLWLLVLLDLEYLTAFIEFINRSKEVALFVGVVYAEAGHPEAT